MDCEASATREDLEFILLNEDAEPKPLPLSLLVDITSDFSDENIIGSGGFARVYKGSIRNRTVAVKRLQPVLHFDENGFHREIKCLMKVKHQNVVRFLGYCNETRGKMAGFNGTLVMAQEQERLLCFQYLSKGGLDNYITDASSGLEWEQRYRIINGVCQGLHQLHEDNILHMDLKPQNILLGDDMVPKIADFGLSRRLHEDQSYVITKNLCGTHGYMAPEFIDSNPENRAITKKCDLYSLGVIIMELLTGTRKQCAVNDVLDSWISRLGESKTKAQLEQIKECAQIAIECSNPRAENRPPDTKHIIDRLEKVGTQQSTGKLLLQAHPTFLVFELQPAGKLSPCLLDLTNDTDERMMFKLRTAESRGESREFYSDSSMEESVHRCLPEQFLPRHGIVAARSTYTLILTVSWEREIPEKRFCDMILESWPERNSNSEAKEEVKLTAYLSTQHRQSTIPTATGQLGVTISWMEKPRTELYSVDAHPTKPWIITGHERGRVTIRNHDTQKLLYSFKVSRGPVHSVKFIARKQWFICATAAEGLAHVYSYETQEMQKINSFIVCYDNDPVCLAVHPSLPYVMSWWSAFTYNEGIKLWDWDNGWECTRTFQISSKRTVLRQVAFDPKETNRFAAAIAVDPCDADDVTIWSLYCPEPEYHLPLTDFKGISFLEFLTRDDLQYLIIANEYREARVWDLQQRKFVFEPSVFSHPNLPLVITPSRNGACCFWSAKDISHYYGVLDNSNGGDVHCIACLMGSKTRFVIGQSYALIVLDIQKATFQEDLQESTETKLCDDTRHAYTSSEFITQGSSEIHHIHPLKAHFSFEDDDLIPCLLHLTNKIDKHIAFMLSSTIEKQPFEATPLNHGIVPSRSIYTLDYKMPKGEKKSNLILQSSISGDRYIHTFQYQSECDQFFEDAKETRNVVHEMLEEPVLSHKGETASENRSTGQDVTQTLIQIRGLCYPTTDNYDVISSLDVNPAESWIMTFHQNGDFFIRDIDTQETIYLMNTNLDVYSVKIITRKQWVLVGTHDGFIHVYEYETGMTRIKRFKVGEPYASYTDRSGVLAVHPTLPYVLSAYGSDMKLWDWDKGWECIQTFELEFYDSIRQVAFSPKGTNNFATASNDPKLKLWNHSPPTGEIRCRHNSAMNFLDILDSNTFATFSSDRKIKLWSHSSPTVEYTLCGHNSGVKCLDFFGGDDGNQYLVSGSDDCTAKIWDLQKKTCLHTLDVFLSPVTSVKSLPDSPYMVTGSEDGTVHLWRYPSFRLERVLQIGCTRPVRSLCLMGSKRALIEKMGEISIMDIDTSPKEPPELLLHVHPTTLVFELQSGKLSQCSLQLTNDTDQHMAFKLSSTECVDWSEQFLPRYGIVAARSTYTLILNVFLERDIAEKRFCDMILESCTTNAYMSHIMIMERDLYEVYIVGEMTKNGVNEVKLTAFLSSSQYRQSIVAPMPTAELGIRVSWMEKPWTRLLSVDAHPTEPWIITGHQCGRVAIQNHDTQTLLSSLKVSRRGVYSVKFIAPKQWFICSSADGFIHAYSYETQEMQKINSFRAAVGGLMSLAVHPTQPYVMSWRRTVDTFSKPEMRLWDWDKGWECTRTFQTGDINNVDRVAFEPKETNRLFATDSPNKEVTIWSLDCPEPEYHLPLKDFKGIRFLEFFARYGRQYLIIANERKEARVWDLQQRKFVFEKRKSLTLEASVFSQPNLPLLLTPSSKGTCRFWSAKDFSFYGVLDNSGGGYVQGFACLMGSKRRFVVGQEYALTILHIDNATYQKDTRQSIEPQLCAHTRQGDTSSETSSSSLAPSNEMMILVDPRQLRFPAIQEVSSTLKISNIKDHHVAFSICWSLNHTTSDYDASPDKGVVPPQSTLHVVLRRVAQKRVPAAGLEELEEVVFVMAIVVGEGLSSTDVTHDMFDETKTGRNVQLVQLKVAFVPSEFVRGSQIISKVRLPWTLDAHPTEPWIMITHGDCHVHIWNYETRESKPITIKGREVTSVKFVACEKWIVAGCASGIIYIYRYDPAERNQVKKIQVLKGHSKSINHLTVHAPYVLSASQDGKILIWHYGNEWELVKTCNAKSPVMHVAFNPQDINTFASAQDKTVKIWDLHSDNDCKLQLSGHSDLVMCLDYFSLGDKLYLITGSKDKTAKIWDFEMGCCIQTMKGHTDVVKVTYCHLDLPILITGSWDGSVRLWDSTTFRHERTLNFDHGEVHAIASLKGSTRIVLANEKGVALVDIDLEGKKDADVENTVVNMGDVIVPTSLVTHSVPEDDPVITASVTHDVPIVASGVSEITWKNIIVNSPVQFGSISDFLKQDM